MSTVLQLQQPSYTTAGHTTAPSQLHHYMKFRQTDKGTYCMGRVRPFVDPCPSLVKLCFPPGERGELFILVMDLNYLFAVDNKIYFQVWYVENSQHERNAVNTVCSE